jgi:Family of unknown function (DUF5906)
VASSGVCTVAYQRMEIITGVGRRRSWSSEIINDAMLNLIAWQLQNVGKQSRIIVVLISEKQQTGKGSLLDDILCRIWGDAGFSTMELSDVLGDFNDVLRGKGYVFLDEALFAGDRRAADKVKGLCARPMLQLNKKFVPLVTVPNGVNLWISSNHEMPVYVEEHDKRYWPMRIWQGRRDDHDYWLALHREIDNGGLEAFLWEMLNRDVATSSRNATCRTRRLFGMISSATASTLATRASGSKNACPQGT